MRKMKTMDGNAAAAYISYAFTELAAIYHQHQVQRWLNLLISGRPKVRKISLVNPESSRNAIGSWCCRRGPWLFKTGALTTTYTASQGLLLMIPNMYKIAGELLPSVFRGEPSFNYECFKYFGDQGDVMAARQTGFAMLSESSVQEVMDLAPVAHLASIEASVPFMNFLMALEQVMKFKKWQFLTMKN